MRFLVDSQLPPGLVQRLVAAGHEAKHLHEVLSPDTKDLNVAAEANRQKAILVSKDEDFVDLSRRGVLEGPLLWIRAGNVTNAALWRLLEPLLPAIESAFVAGERIVEIR